MGSQMNFKNVGDTSYGDGKQAGNFPLARQPSVYSLTFEEFQNTWGGLGKDFGSMNMDELLKNIWTAEENHAMNSSASAAGESNAPGGNLQRQGSLTLPRTLSQKTVDEVWRDLMKEGSGGAAAARGQVVTVTNSSMNGNLVQAGGLQGGGMGMVGLGAGGVTLATGSQVAQVSPDMIAKSTADVSSPSPVPYVFGRGRKSGALEKVVERRHRRMIKNRESAARSRARKQAYTLELEAEVAKLKELNQELERKQAEKIEMEKNKIIEKMKYRWGGKILCLRRTLTGPW
ncbi:hypothetical protein CUMW_160290 [Citrus unshiu]|nr:hypothetical protein CUMW_160290 [Citrus unshiu]